MSEQAKKYRAAMRAKAMRMGGAKSAGKVDASDFGPVEQDPLQTDKAQGMRPISKRAYKNGGAVAGGAAGLKHGGRAARKHGGGSGAAMLNALSNTDMKEANEKRDGAVKREGGLKHGGTKKWGGGPLGVNPANNPQADVNPANVPTGRMGFSPGKSSVGIGIKKGGKVEHPHKDEDEKCAKKLVEHHRKDGGEAKDEKPDSKSGFGEAPEKTYGSKKDWRKVGDNVFGPRKKQGGGLAGAGPMPPDEGPPPDDMPMPPPPRHKKKKDGKKALIQALLEQAENGGGGPPDEGPPPGLGAKHGGKRRAEGGGVYAPNLKPGPREHHAHGGKAGKGRTNINIIIGAHPHGGGDEQSPMAPPPPPPPPPRAMPVPPPAPPPGMPPGGGAPPPMGGPPPMGPPPGMPRKHGGRAYPIEDGAGGGKGRLQKIRAYGLKPAG